MDPERNREAGPCSTMLKLFSFVPFFTWNWDVQSNEVVILTCFGTLYLYERGALACFSYSALARYKEGFHG